MQGANLIIFKEERLAVPSGSSNFNFDFFDGGSDLETWSSFKTKHGTNQGTIVLG
jgi:hypothetical protein